MSEDKPLKQAVRGTDGKFLPGHPGNPKGRPAKGECLTSLLRELLVGDPEAVIKKWQQGKVTGAMRVAIAWYKKLSTSDMTALKEALDRVEGKVAQPVTGAGGEPIALNIVVNSQAAKGTLDSIAGKV